ncbi:MAG: hypothetical protein AB7O91_06230 [Sphingomonas sp.]
MRELIGLTLLDLLLTILIAGLLIHHHRRRRMEEFHRGHSDYSKVRRPGGFLG